MTPPKSNPEQKSKIFDFVLAFVLPTLIGKATILYFGGNYASNPGEGYGYGLAASIAFTLFMVGRFLWKYRNHKDD